MQVEYDAPNIFKITLSKKLQDTWKLLSESLKSVSATQEYINSRLKIDHQIIPQICQFSQTFFFLSKKYKSCLFGYFSESHISMSSPTYELNSFFSG